MDKQVASVMAMYVEEIFKRDPGSPAARLFVLYGWNSKAKQFERPIQRMSLARELHQLEAPAHLTWVMQKLKDGTPLEPGQQEELAAAWPQTEISLDEATVFLGDNRTRFGLAKDIHADMKYISLGRATEILVLRHRALARVHAELGAFLDNHCLVPEEGPSYMECEAPTVRVIVQASQ